MGFVFKARHRLLDKVVALKLVPAESMADSARLARFQREMRAMGQLEHPNLVPAADARSAGKWHLVAMELIDGVDLMQLVRVRGSLPVAAACEAARQAAQGLQYAHQHGLIHRDIKPSNLMLTRAGIIKVIDLGLALAREDSTAQLTQTGLIMGTTSYCAPEQFRDASHVDIRADIYSLGCTLHHLLTGKAPYWQRKTITEIMQAHLHEPFPRLGESLPDVPAGLEVVLARMTAKDPDARFSTPSEVVGALEPFARDAELGPLVPEAAPQSPPRRIKTPLVERRYSSSREPRPKGWLRRAAALLVLLFVIAGAVFTLLPKPPASSGISANRAPVVVLMDTTAPRGVYDEANKQTGRSNAKELYDVLHKEIKGIPPENMHEVPVGVDWGRQDFVRSLHPDLVVIHRSVFYHPVAAALNYPYPPFKTHEEYESFQQRYKILGDDKLRDFLGFVGSAVPHTRFLVYSRGTDTNWLSASFHKDWTRELEVQYPLLATRVTTMVIPGETNGTFREPKTREELVRKVKAILRLPE